MKFLVTGSAGLVGSQVVKDLTKLSHTVYACYHKTLPMHGIPIHLDLKDIEKTQQTIQETKPDGVIHLAAITNVDLCETERELAHLINTSSTETLARQAARQNAFFVYVSTDYVFDGRHGMRKEDDTPNPLGFYGKTKLEGETALNKIVSPWCIARTSTPFGAHAKNSFPMWVKENLESKKEISILTDQYTSPTYIPNLSRMLIEVTTRQIAGVIHLAGTTRVSRYDMARLVAEKLNLNQTLLKKTTMSKMSWKAQRPADSSLDVSLASSILYEKPKSITQSLDLFVSQLQNE